MEDKKQLIEENKDNYSLLCHFCKNLKNIHEMVICTGEECQESFCKDCIERNFKSIESFEELRNEYEENGWICYKCQRICKCNSCILLFENGNVKENKSNNIFDSSLLNLKKTNDFQINDFQNNFFNGKNNEIFEFLNDKNFNKSLTKNNGKYIYYYQPNNNLLGNLPTNLKNASNSNKNSITPRLKKKLFKIAALCEHYYHHKCKSIYFKKNCEICYKNEHCLNELLRFKNSKDFLNYLRYLYLCKYEIVDYSNYIFLNNKKELLNSFRDYEKENSTWSFHSPKILCKSCVLKIINKKNSFDIFKKILIDKDKNKINDNNNIDYNKTKEKINEDNIKIVNNNPTEKKEVKFRILEVLKNAPKNEEKFNDTISEKRYDELRDILDILLQNIYKFILVVNSFNFQRYLHLFTFFEQNFKYFYEYLIKIQENIKYNLKSFIEFQENYGHQINEFIRSYHNSSNTDFLFEINFMLSIKIQNKSCSEGIQENVEKFLKYSNDYLDNILKRIRNK